MFSKALEKGFKGLSITVEQCNLCGWVMQQWVQDIF